MDASRGDAGGEAEEDIAIERIERIGQLARCADARARLRPTAAPGPAGAAPSHVSGAHRDEARRDDLALGVDANRAVRNGNVGADAKNLAVMNEDDAVLDDALGDRVDVGADDGDGWRFRGRRL